MQLPGSTFTCEVPDGWSETREPGCVIAAAPTGQLGFAANAVLRESRIEQRPDSLAAVCQANLRAVHEMPGALVTQVEALELHGVEHRRIWMLCPATSEEIHGNILSLLSIQDLTVVGGAVAELTVTQPLIEWTPNDRCQGILETLQAMPSAERVLPPTTADVRAPALDEWASRRDGLPRENLSVIRPPSLVLQAEPFTLNEEAATYITKPVSRAFTPLTDEARAELTAYDLVDANGAFNARAYWYADHMITGAAWTITVEAPTPREFQFWVTDTTTVFVAPHPEEPGKKLLGYCPSNDIFRLAIAWVEATPSWPLDVYLEIPAEQLQAKVERNQTPQLSGDVGEFVSQPWTPISLTDGDGQPHVSWIHTPYRGDAMLWSEMSKPNPQNLISLRQHPGAPLWLRLIATISNSEEQR